MELREYIKIMPASNCRIVLENGGSVVIFKDLEFSYNSDIVERYGISTDKLQSLYKGKLPISHILSFCEKLHSVDLGLSDSLQCSLIIYAAFCEVTDVWEKDTLVANYDTGVLIYNTMLIQNNSDFAKAIGIATQDLHKIYASKKTLQEIVKSTPLQNVYSDRQLLAQSYLLQEYSEKELAEVLMQNKLLPETYLTTVMGKRFDTSVEPVTFEFLNGLNSTRFIANAVGTIEIDLRKEDNRFVGATVSLPMCMHFVERSKQRELLTKHKKALYSYAIQQLMLNKVSAHLRNTAHCVQIDNAIYTKDERLVITISWDI